MADGGDYGGGWSSDPGGPPGSPPFKTGKGGKSSPVGCLIFAIALLVCVVACWVFGSIADDMWGLELPPP